ncbi:MAG: hypothetical protein M1815_003647 [Lichina confinis]|nr:MAG: hypothetical protein M1815_003647 [Lichina confinis]
MPNSAEDRKAATLARVRVNQQRCRARKQQYISELEQRVKELEQMLGNHAMLELQHKVEKLEEENRHLRAMLQPRTSSHPSEASQVDPVAGELGVANNKQTAIGESLQRAIEASSAALKLWTETVAGPAGWQGLEPRLTGAQGSASSSGDVLDTVATGLREEAAVDGSLDMIEEPYELDMVIPDSLLGDLDDIGGQSPSPTRLQTRPTLSDEPLPCGVPELDASCSNGECQQSDAPNSSTTLCSVAFRLISSFNHTNVNLSEIVSELRMGFRKGDGDHNSCRVENTLLYSLLYRILG